MNFDVDTNSVSESNLTHAGLDPLSLRNPFEPSQNLFSDLSRGPQAMPGLPNFSSQNWDTGGEGKGQFENSLSSPLQPVLDEPESVNSWVDKVLTEIPIVDSAVKTSTGLLTNSSALIEHAAESSGLLAKDTAEGIGETIRNWVDTAAESWNDPNNSVHNELNYQAKTFVDGLGELATDIGNSQWMASLKQQLGSASEGLDSWVGDINSSLGYVDDSSTTQEATALEAAELRLKENLVNLSENPDFLKTFETAFGDDIEVSEATELVGDFVSGDKGPEIKVIAAADLKGEGAFGDNTIFVSDQLIAQSSDNTETLDAVLLEEAGHYFDQELNATDSAGDEGAIFSRLARGQAITDGDLLRLKREEDHSTLLLGDQVIEVENYYLSDAEKVEIQSSTNTPVDGSDRRLYQQAGTVDAFDAALDAQQESSTPSPVKTPVDGSDRRLYQQAGTVDKFDAAYEAQPELSTPVDNGSDGSVTIASGDTLSEIAAQHGVQWTDLRNANGEVFTEEEARNLQVGAEVLLPGQRTNNSDSLPQSDPDVVQTSNGGSSEIEEPLNDEVESLSEQIDAIGTSSPSVTRALQEELEPLELELEKAELDEQIDAIGTSSPSVTNALQDERSDVETKQTELALKDQQEALQDERGRLQNEAESLDEQIDAIGTSSPSVTNALQDEQNNVETELTAVETQIAALDNDLGDLEPELTKIQIEDQQEALQDESRRLQNEAESLDEQIDAIGTSSPSVTNALQDEQSDIETELTAVETQITAVDNDLRDLEPELTRIGLERREEQLVNDSGQLRDQAESLDEQIDAIGTSSPSVTNALQDEQAGIQGELTLQESELREVRQQLNQVEAEEYREQLPDKIASLKAQISALGTSSASVTEALRDELAKAEQELHRIELEETIDILGTSSPSVTTALQSELRQIELEEQIDALGTSSPSVTNALQAELNTLREPNGDSLAASDQEVAEMGWTGRGQEIIGRSFSHLDDEIVEQIKGLLTPENIALIALNGNPVGRVVGFLFDMQDYWDAGQNLINVVSTIKSGKTSEELDEAAEDLAELIVFVGVEAIGGNTKNKRESSDSSSNGGRENSDTTDTNASDSTLDISSDGGSGISNVTETNTLDTPPDSSTNDGGGVSDSTGNIPPEASSSDIDSPSMHGHGIPPSTPDQPMSSRTGEQPRTSDGKFAPYPDNSRTPRSRPGSSAEDVVADFNGWEKNTKPIGENGRIPDFVDDVDNPKFIAEVKDVDELSNIQQLKDYAELVGPDGQVVIYVDSRTTLAGTLHELNNSWEGTMIRYEFIPW